MMESITWSRDIIRRIAICVVLLTSLYGISESQVEVCFQQNDMGMMGENCACTSTPPVLPRPLFCEKCFVGKLPDNLMSINGSCETNATVPSSTICTFECEEGYTLSHNETIQCMGGQFSHPIPSCNETDECLSNPCMNGGTCSDFLNEYNCTCVPGYEGVHCENETDECRSNPCMNGGTCNDFLNEYNCTCVPGYEGVHCENETDECRSNPCMNGGTCNDFLNEYNCTCVPGYEGVHCENETDECRSNPCMNGGICNDFLNEYNCTCVPGYEGVHCENVSTTTASTTESITATPLTTAQDESTTTATSPSNSTPITTMTIADDITTSQETATTSTFQTTSGSDANTSDRTYTTEREMTTAQSSTVSPTSETILTTTATTSAGISITEIDITTAPSPTIFTTSEPSTTVTAAEAVTTTAQTSTESDGTMSGGIGTTDIQITTTPSLPFHTTSESSIATTVDQSTITPQTSPESVARTSGEPGTTEEAISTTLQTVTAPSVSQSTLTTDGLTTIQSEPMTEPTTTISSPATLTTTSIPITATSTPITATTSAPTSQSETMSNSSSNSPSSPTVTVCIVPTHVMVNSVSGCWPGDTVASGTYCTFGCNNTTGTTTCYCSTNGLWEPRAPDCGVSGGPVSVNLSSINTDNETGRKRRDVLPLDNAAVAKVQETFEMTIQELDTTYLVNATTVSAQNCTNDVLQMNLLFGIMYTSAITMNDLISQVEAALLAVDEFTVISVDLSDLDALCTPNPCENKAGCTVDYNNFNFTCSCPVGYSGLLCSDSSSVLLISILVPTVTLIVAFTVFTIVLVVYYRVRLHQLKGYKRSSHRNMAMESANGYHGDLKQLYFTEDKTPGYHDQGTLKNSTLGLRFSKEINARMQERSRQMEFQAPHLPAYYIGPADRHPRQTDHVRNGRSLSNGDQALQTFHQNGIHSRDKASQGHMADSSSVEYNYAAITNQSKTRRHSSRDNHRNRTTSTSQGVSYNRRRTRDDLDGRNRAPLERTRNGGIPRSMHVETEFNDTRL